MPDAETQRPPTTESPAERTDPAIPPSRKARRHFPRRSQAWLVLGLSGLLGAVWAVAIVSRYPGVMPG